MRNEKPLVSIGIPVYNGENYLRDCLTSVCSQTYDNLEIIICDNASSDATKEICEEFVLKDSRIKYYRNKENLGAAPNYNKAFLLSSGKYFKWQAHDDIIEKKLIEKCVEVAEKHKDVSLVYARRTIIDKDGKKIKDIDDKLFFFDESPALRYKRFLKRFTKSTEFCDPIFGLIRSENLKNTRLFGSFHTSDMILLAELLLEGKFYEVEDRLFLRRIHEKISTTAYSDPKSRALWFDTKKKNKITFHYFRWYLEFIKTIMRSKISLSDKIISLCQLNLWALKLWKGFAVNIRDGARDIALSLISNLNDKIKQRQRTIKIVKT